MSKRDNAALWEYLHNQKLEQFTQYSRPVKSSVYLLGAREVIDYLSSEWKARAETVRDAQVIVFYATHGYYQIPSEMRYNDKEYQGERTSIFEGLRSKRDAEAEVRALGPQLSNYTSIATFNHFDQGTYLTQLHPDVFNPALNAATHLYGRLEGIYQLQIKETRNAGLEDLIALGSMLKKGLDGIENRYRLSQDIPKWNTLKVTDEMKAISTTLVELGHLIDMRDPARGMPAAYFKDMLDNELKGLAQSLNSFYGSFGEAPQAQQSIALYVRSLAALGQQLRQ